MVLSNVFVVPVRLNRIDRVIELLLVEYELF